MVPSVQLLAGLRFHLLLPVLCSYQTLLIALHQDLHCLKKKKKNTLRPGILQALLQIESLPSKRVIYNFPLSLSRTWRLLYRSWEQGQRSASPEWTPVLQVGAGVGAGSPSSSQLALPSPRAAYPQFWARGSCCCCLVTLCDPMDCSPPGSSVRGIL